jgi:hypothetical protein
MQHKKLRHELKYFIRPYEYHALRGSLSSLLQRDRNSTGPDGYHIRSLYLDNIQDSALYEKNFGVIQRKKYRIRIYNHSDRIIRLERKSRFGEWVCKEAANLSLQEYRSILEGKIDFLADRQEPLLNQLYIGFRTQRLRPTIIVDYVREAYTSALGGIRVTFDKELSAVFNTYDIFDPNAVAVSVIREPKLILEVKYDRFIPEHIAGILQLPAHQRAAISKYVICREVMKSAQHL